MKYFIALIIWFGSLSAGAQTLTDSLILQSTYADSQYMGIALGNHTSFKVFEALEEFLQSPAGLDPQLKFIFVEGSFELEKVMKRISLLELNWQELPEEMDPYWSLRAFGAPQMQYFYSQFLATLQKVNELRKEQPILVVPIDSYTIQWNKIDEATIREKGYVIFGGSTTREKMTANIFLDIIEANPQAKGIVIYHQAHILKNLNSLGYEIDSEGNFLPAQNNHLGWVGFVQEVLPDFYEQLKVVLIDEKDTSFNTEGIIDFQALGLNLPEVGSGYIIQPEYPLTEAGVKNNSFLKRYRGKSILFPQKAIQSFDAIIRY